MATHPTDSGSRPKSRRITKNLLSEAQLDVGDEVDIRVKEGILVVSPTRRIRSRYSLKVLVERIPKGCTSGEAHWGEPTGKEI